MPPANMTISLTLRAVTNFDYWFDPIGDPRPPALKLVWP
jgi:hypothetical protein